MVVEGAAFLPDVLQTSTRSAPGMTRTSNFVPSATRSPHPKKAELRSVSMVTRTARHAEKTFDATAEPRRRLRQRGEQPHAGHVVDDANVQRAIRVVRGHRKRDASAHHPLVRHEHPMGPNVHRLVHRLAGNPPGQPRSLGEPGPEHDVRARRDPVGRTA